MIVAVDSRGKRLYADAEIKYKECFCQQCGEPLTHKKGTVKRPYFSHRPDSSCPFSLDKDYKSEWHIRMQDYFPKEEREYRFIDESTGEVHIADVYIEKAKTVLEFQHSPISEAEFLSRTWFHIENGRRIVWLFDESSNSSDSSFGRFRKIPNDFSILSAKDALNRPYLERKYKWMRIPRKILRKGPSIKESVPCYSVCVYTGTEGDVFHRIINENFSFEEVIFSIHNIEMNKTIDVEDFFKPEEFWQNQPPWKEIFEVLREDYRKEAERDRLIQQAQNEVFSRMAMNSLIRNPPRRRYRRF